MLCEEHVVVSTETGSSFFTRTLRISLELLQLFAMGCCNSTKAGDVDPADQQADHRRRQEAPDASGHPVVLSLPANHAPLTLTIPTQLVTAVTA